MQTFIIGLLVFNIVALGATKLLKKKPSAITTDGVSVEATQANLSRSKTEKFALLARIFKGRKESSVIERNLVTANILIKPTEFLAINLVIEVVFLILGVLVMRYMSDDGKFFTLVKRLAILGFIVMAGWRGPQMVLAFLANKRRSTLEVQLADALTIISSSLKGGYSFVQGLDMAGTQMEEPIKSEINRVIRLIQLGLDTPRALLQMSERINSYDYDMTISATNIQLAVGGNLSSLLEGISMTIRDRIRLRRDISALTAQGRISGGILFVLPIGIGAFLCVINWEYMSALFTPMGYNILYMATIQMAFGFLWIKKLLDFDN